MNTDYRKPLGDSGLDYFDAQAAINNLEAGAYARLPYTSKVLAENLVRRCEPEQLNAALQQLIERKRDLDSPGILPVWFVMTFSGKPRWWTWRDCAMP